MRNRIWDRLEDTLREDGAFFPDRLEAKNLSRMFHCGRAAMRCEELEGIPTVIAFLGCAKTDDDEWGEICLAHVHKKKRRTGLQAEMFGKLLMKPKVQTRLLAVSMNPAFIATACKREYGFRIVCSNYQPGFDINSWWMKLGMENRDLPDTINVPFVPTGKERWLLVRQ